MCAAEGNDRLCSVQEGRGRELALIVPPGTTTTVVLNVQPTFCTELQGVIVAHGQASRVPRLAGVWGVSTLNALSLGSKHHKKTGCFCEKDGKMATQEKGTTPTSPLCTLYLLVVVEMPSTTVCAELHVGALSYM